MRQLMIAQGHPTHTAEGGIMGWGRKPRRWTRLSIAIDPSWSILRLFIRPAMLQEGSIMISIRVPTRS